MFTDVSHVSNDISICEHKKTNIKGEERVGVEERRGREERKEEER
jgi:hypothetical protein